MNLRLHPSLKSAAERTAAKDHRSLTSLIEKLLSEHVWSKPTLERWHQLAQASYSELSAADSAEARRHGGLVRSYAIHCADDESINPHQLVRVLQVAHANLSNVISSPHSFTPYTRTDRQPYYTADKLLEREGNEEILECAALPDEFWRVSPAGYATDIRPHFEDSRPQIEPGQKFCPFFMTRHIYTLLNHAYLLSTHFQNPERVEFYCEWSGLQKREIWDPRPEVNFTWLPGKIAQAEHRVTTGEWPIDVLRQKWPEVIVELGGPVMRLFDPSFDYSSDWVRAQFTRAI